MDNEYIFYHDDPMFNIVLNAISENDNNPGFIYYGRSTVTEVRSATGGLVYASVHDFARRANVCARLCTAHSSGMNPYGIRRQDGEFFADHYDSEQNVREYDTPPRSPARRNRNAHMRAVNVDRVPGFKFASNGAAFDLREGNNNLQPIYLNQFERLFPIGSIQTTVENVDAVGATRVIPGMVVIFRNNFRRCITICTNIEIRDIVGPGELDFSCICKISVVTTLRENEGGQSRDHLRGLSKRTEFNEEEETFNNVFGQHNESRERGVDFRQLFQRHDLNQELIPGFGRLDLNERRGRQDGERNNERNNEGNNGRRGRQDNERNNIEQQQQQQSNEEKKQSRDQ